MMYSQVERVLILEQYFSSMSFSVFREAFSNVNPDKEVTNNTKLHPLLQYVETEKMFGCDKCKSQGKSVE